VMFCGLLFFRADMAAVAISLTVAGALAMAVGLYTWLTSPLE